MSKKRGPQMQRKPSGTITASNGKMLTPRDQKLIETGRFMGAFETRLKVEEIEARTNALLLYQRTTHTCEQLLLLCDLLIQCSNGDALKACAERIKPDLESIKDARELVEGIELFEPKSNMVLRIKQRLEMLDAIIAGRDYQPYLSGVDAERGSLWIEIIEMVQASEPNRPLSPSKTLIIEMDNECAQEGVRYSDRPIDILSRLYSLPDNREGKQDAIAQLETYGNFWDNSNPRDRQEAKEKALTYLKGVRRDKRNRKTR